MSSHLETDVPSSPQEPVNEKRSESSADLHPLLTPTHRKRLGSMAAEASETPGASRVRTEKRTENALMYVLIFFSYSYAALSMIYMNISNVRAKH